ncbi:MAG: L,D-transpeptidase family protein [Pseudomonadota bacterium]
MDGVAGPATIRAMNHSVDDRIAQIITNMERWRWLPRELGTKHVFVNQAAFSLHIRNDGRITDQRKVIIGKEFHKTPMFSDRIRYAEFNPTWTVPTSIAGRAILPKLKQSPSYLEANDYKLFTSWKPDAPAMSAYSIDWNSINPKRFPYRIVQMPGKKNALGQVKFMFPNKHAVYLHDTSQRELFSRTRRAYSSGCIRVHRPMEFAEKLFASSGNLSSGKIDSILESRKTTRVNLAKPIPVHLTYFTVWVNEEGVPNFYEDIYGRDRLVGNLLFGNV